MTAEAILRLLNDPVLPFYPLDVALDVQNKLKGIRQDCITLFLRMWGDEKNKVIKKESFKVLCYRKQTNKYIDK